MSYRTEQEQIEIFTRWWKEKGRLTLVALVLALIAYVGWTQWQGHRHQRAEEASVLYNDLLKSAESKSPDAAGLATRLRDEYADTFYGRAALLFLAEASVAKNDLAGAEVHLDTLIKQNAGDDLGLTARLRSAKVLHALGKEDEALVRLSGQVPAGFDVLFAELRGDIYMVQGQNDKARLAYQEAITALESDNSTQKEVLDMKLSQAGGAP
jgi:predicted negative regulator of RcsB-dependent stress response